MNKKPRKEGKQGSNLNKFLARNKQDEAKSPPPTTRKNEGKKKVCHSLNEFLHSKDVPVETPAFARKFKLQHLLKQISVEQALQKCPKLQQLVQFLSGRADLGRQTVAALLGKYLSFPPQGLWSRKYAPKTIAQLFNPEAGKRIQEWINAFFQYRNKIVEEESFPGEAESVKSCRVYQKIRENQWQLQALIVRGRPGIGKTSAIRAVAEEMDIDLQECGNDYNQLKYLKEKNESTQSQSVKTAYTRKTKVEKDTQMITKFMPAVEKEKPKENKKSQMFHNISVVYPESEAPKFYNQLGKCVQLSKIPFILTNSGEKLPKDCQRYDLIEFDSGSNQLIDKCLWVICHIECLCFLNKAVEIEEEALFDQINLQTEPLECVQICSLGKIKELCLLCNYRLDYIFTFLQHHRRKMSSISIFPLLIQKYKNLNEDQLLDEISFIDFDKIKFPNERSYLIEKTEENNNTQDQSENDKPKEDKEEMSLGSYRREIRLAAAEDTLAQYSQDFGFRQHSADVSAWEDHPYTCINVNVHRGIKVSLTRMANHHIDCSFDKIRSSLRPSELCFLPMLLREKRASRVARGTVGQGLRRVYDGNELCYLSHFVRLIKQE